MDWMGETELFAVVFIGQSDPMNKAGVSEVRLRSDTVHLQGLTVNEVKKYVEETIGRVFSSKAIKAISLLPESENYLDLQSILLSLMGRALAEGHAEVQYDDVLKEFGSEQIASLEKADVVSLQNIMASLFQIE